MFRFTRISLPFYQLEGGGAQGGAPQGGQQGGGQQQQQQAPQGGGQGGAGGGSIFDLTPDSMVRVPGQANPVKWADYQRGYIPQSEFTKKTQAHAEAVKAWEAEKAAATEKLLGEARKMAEARNAGGGQQQQDPLAELRGQDYINGKTAASILEAIQQRGIQPIVAAIGERDKVITQLHGELQKLSGVIQQMQQTSGMSALKQRLGTTRQSLELPDDPAAMEYLEDLYSSHDGEDWDSQFDSAAKTKLDKLRNMFRAMDKQAAEKARKRLIAGGGGNAVPGGKLNEGFKSPAQVADSMAAAFGIPD
jgi:hypothetical protein